MAKIVITIRMLAIPYIDSIPPIKQRLEGHHRFGVALGHELLALEDFVDDAPAKESKSAQKPETAGAGYIAKTFAAAEQHDKAGLSAEQDAALEQEHRAPDYQIKGSIVHAIKHGQSQDIKVAVAKHGMRGGIHANTC